MSTELTDALKPGPQPTRPNAALGISLLLTGLAIWLVIWGFWIQVQTYEKYRGRTDLDMPEWFGVNLDLTIKILPLFFLAGLFNLISLGSFFVWAGNVGWFAGASFIIIWLSSVVLVLVLAFSRAPLI